MEETQSTFENITVEHKGEGVALVTLNRPKALNALNNAMCAELISAFDSLGKDNSIGAIVLTGSQKAFAAGADIKEMKEAQFPDTFVSNLLADWAKISECKKPTIAAVSGFCLGGGCEVAMMLDILVASDTAKFGQPEVNLGIIPGIGGTQRLTRAVGKSRAMEMILTGEAFLTADEALRLGLVSRVFPADQLIEEACKIAAKIASKSRPSIAIARECVNMAFETSLSNGL